MASRPLNLGMSIAAAALLTAAALIANTADADVAIDAPAPVFTALDSTGASVSLADFAGQPVILEWSNHDCPYVRKHYDAGAMQALQKSAAANGFAWLTVVSSAPGEQGHVSAGQANALTEARDAAPTRVLLDPEGEVGRLYAAKTTPHMFVINADGVVVYDGAIDDQNSANPDTLEGATNYVALAINAVAKGEPVAIAQTQPYGCSVKYGS
ncbi:MAG: redoxin domain-containing protein [Maricaulaceae bacterium]